MHDCVTRKTPQQSPKNISTHNTRFSDVSLLTVNLIHFFIDIPKPSLKYILEKVQFDSTLL